MGIKKYGSQLAYFKHYPNDESLRGCEFSKSRCSKKKFNRIMNLIDWDIDWMTEYFIRVTKEVIFHIVHFFR